MTTSRIFEPELRINPNTRKIFIPDELYNICVVTDDNSEIIKIRVPRYFDGCDFSTKDCTITYNNAMKERGIYKVNDMEILDDSLLLQWCISNHVTKKAGKIYFVVEFKTSNAEHNKTYSWSTIPAELNVLPWLDDNVKYTDDDNIINHLSLFSHKHHNMDILNQLTQPMIDLLECIKDTYEKLIAHVKNINIPSGDGLHVPTGGKVGQVLGRIHQEDLQVDPRYAWIDQTGSDINIPENVSAFINDIGYQTEQDVLEIVKNKVDKQTGLGLSENNYTNAEKEKLSNIPNIIFSTTIPTELEENTICFVYED